jgi:hypothetical protein
MYSMKRRWWDRTKVVEMPLFPVFRRFGPKIRLPILKIDTVMAVPGLGKTPEPIPDAEIEALQRVCKSGVQSIPCPYPTLGTKVRLIHGRSSGVEGILTEPSANSIVLSVTLLRRSVTVEVDGEGSSRSESTENSPLPEACQAAISVTL